MKTTILSILLFGIVMFAQGQPPQVPADPGSVFGAALTAEGAIPVASVNTLLEGKESAAVKVVAKVIDVCPKKGCWMLLETTDQSKVFVKMKDYGFFVPTAITGKTVIIDAEAKLVTTSVDELKHYAEDAKKSKEEIEAIKQPKKEVRLTANGILVVK